eukprot:1655919-Amphidinium_carterae.1
MTRRLGPKLGRLTAGTTGRGSCEPTVQEDAAGGAPLAPLPPRDLTFEQCGKECPAIPQPAHEW